MTENEERWKPVVGYEGLYEVSDRGRVRSLDRWVTFSDGKRRLYKGRELSVCVDQIDSKYPYKRCIVTLCKEGTQSTRKVHSLVYEAFVGKIPEGLHICHNNGNSCDNRLENLRADTPKSNTQDSIRHGTFHTKLSFKDVVKIRRLLEKGEKSMRSIARDFGVHHESVRKIKAGVIWDREEETSFEASKCESEREEVTATGTRPFDIDLSSPNPRRRSIHVYGCGRRGHSIEQRSPRSLPLQRRVQSPEDLHDAVQDVRSGQVP